MFAANEVTCSEQEGHISYHPDKLDCTQYYMCEGERKHHMPCPAQLVFNPNENVCDWPENVESCHHHTQVNLKSFADPAKTFLTSKISFQAPPAK